ncbi:glycosyltransferase [Helicobacter himalayensis]|uniref:glycosyltransferase n=1 Tax=Helicobacter himalayensis TaxID=1591088 RepID=UPI0008297DEA|nr:glycosyltransferase [Helicobacter himalayensis]
MQNDTKNSLNSLNSLESTHTIHISPHIDYIIFLDSDDYWEKECVEECVRAAQKYHLDILQFDSKNYIDMPVALTATPTWLESQHFEKEQIFSQEDLFAYLLKAEGFIDIVVWKLFINFDFFLQNKELFINVMPGEDCIFTLSMLEKASRICLTPKKLYNYRFRSDSTMKSLAKGTFEGISPKIARDSKTFRNPILAKRYHFATQYLILSLAFFDLLEDRKKSLATLYIKKFCFTRISPVAIDLLSLPKDPKNCIPNLQTFIPYLNEMSFGKLDFLKRFVLKKPQYIFLTRLLGFIKDKLRDLRGATP